MFAFGLAGFLMAASAMSKRPRAREVRMILRKRKVHVCKFRLVTITGTVWEEGDK